MQNSSDYLPVFEGVFLGGIFVLFQKKSGKIVHAYEVRETDSGYQVIRPILDFEAEYGSFQPKVTNLETTLPPLSENVIHNIHITAHAA